MRARALLSVLTVLAAAGASAQMRPIFDPDDFVDPRQHEGPVFVSRLVAGAAAGYADDYRPLHQSARFLHLANSYYRGNVQLDYKHSEVRAKDNSPAEVSACGCSEPIYFPTPPSRRSTPAAPLPSRKETLQFAWYHAAGNGAVDPPVMLRYRLSWSWQPADTVIRSGQTGQVLSHLSGDEQAFGLEAETRLRIRGHNLFGALQYAYTVRSGTIDDRIQQELVYTARLPGTSYRGIVLRPTLAVGAVTGRGAAGLNVINPAAEAFWHHPATRANLHLVWSPAATRSGTAGWETHHQLAVYIDRAVYLKVFGRRDDGKKGEASQ